MSTVSEQRKLSDGMPQLSDARQARIDALAPYVALLPWFNVDVLHKLYLNFVPYSPARSTGEEALTEYDLRAISCADFIQSTLVSRIDYNVFIMEPNLRDRLRDQVKENRATMKRMGEFMLAYADHCRPHFLSTRYVEVYKVEGNLIVNPRAEASRIARHVAAQLNSRRDIGKMEPTVGYYLNLLNQNTGNQELTTFLKGLDNYLKKDQAEAQEEWEKLRSRKNAEVGKSISIKLPRNIRQAIVQEIRGAEHNVAEKILAKVFLDRGPSGVKVNLWKSNQTETSTYVFVDDRKKADFIIRLEKGKLKVFFQDGEFPLYETYSERGLGLDNVLQALGRWIQIFRLTNSTQTAVSRDELHLEVEVLEGVSEDEFDDAEGAKFENPEVIRLEYKSENGKEKYPAIRVNMQVIGSQLLYVAILRLMADGNVSIVLPCESTLSGKVYNIDSYEGYREKREIVSMFVYDKFQSYGITEVTDYLKVIVSQDEFSVKDWAQHIKELGNVDNMARSAGLITVDEIDPNTMFRGRPNWLAFNVKMVTTRPLPAESGRALNLDGEPESWKILSNTPSPVRSVAFSPDGQLALTGCADGSLHLFDVASGYCVLSVSEHQGEVYDVAFAPDGRTFLSGSGDHTAKLWSLEGVCLYTLTGHEDSVLAVAFSPRGDTIATGSKDRTHRLWDTRGNTVQTFPEHETIVSSIAFSPDGESCVTAGEYTPWGENGY